MKQSFKQIIGLALLSLAASSYAKNITYSVVASTSTDNKAVAVKVDGTLYPLQVSHGILHRGEAPVANKEYSYAIVNAGSNSVDAIEPFSRPPFDEGDATPNEFFNRSTNKYDVASLPQALEPLSNIHRIESDLHKFNEIPSIHIYGNKSAIDYIQKNQLEDLDVKLSVTYISLKDVYTFDKVKVSLAGRSSRWVPKLSYGLKLKKKNDTTLYGYKNIKLRALAQDPSYIREAISYNVLKSVGSPVSGYSYVRVFIENEPVGLYGLIETFQDPWTAATFANGEKNYQSGYLYQGIGFAFGGKDNFYVSDLGYKGPNTTQYTIGQYKIKAGPSKKKEKDFTDLQEFTKFINESTVETTSTEEWEKRLDVDSFLRAMAIEDLLGLSDAYMTLANNWYLYQDPKQSGRFTYIPADMDTTIGIALFNMTLMTSGNYTEHPGVFFRPLTTKVLAYKKYLDMYKGYLLKITKEIINPTVLYPYIDSVVNMIQQDVDWDQSLERVGITTSRVLQDIDVQADAAKILDLFRSVLPPGYIVENFLNITKPSFEVSINGPSTSVYIESIKPFIAKKSSAVLQFYKQLTQ